MGNSLIGFKLEGVVMNEGVDNTSTVASPFKSRTGEIGVKLELEEGAIDLYSVVLCVVGVELQGMNIIIKISIYKNMIESIGRRPPP